MNEMMTQQEGFSSRCQKVLQVAKDLYQGKPDWVTFFRETLGVNGAARSVFPTQNEYVLFEQSNEHTEIQQMVANLRNRKIPGNGNNEPTRVITVRLPESLHEALKAEASDHNTSMNKLCISKLLQVLVDGEKAAAAAAAPPMRSVAPPQPVPVAAPPQQAAPSFRSTFSPTNPTHNPNNPPRMGQ